ncbi:MAG: hypothetical protein K6F00_05295, partial [Lachnospiraceae bacterium]|nr:hypothetical protein [Lachnospiraceae bacterium]
MIIAHNLEAMNAQRHYNLVEIRKAKSTEKLSSGYRINRAADDAAGLAISEKMRRQVRGLTQASRNCQDGVSLCQVRDGALDTVHGILNRMNELSVQAANGTLSDQDRSYIQVEVDQLVSEINRIGKDTSFNEIPIFDYEHLVKVPGRSGSHATSTAIGTGYLTDTYYENGSYHPSANLDFGGINADTVASMYEKSFSFTCSLSCPEAFTFKFIDGDGSQSSASNLNGKIEHKYVIDIHGLTTARDVLDKVFDYVSANMPNNYSGADRNDLLVSHSNRMVRTSPTSISLVSTRTYPTEQQAASAFASTTGAYGKANCSELAGVLVDDEWINALAIQAGAEAEQFIYVRLDKMNAGLLGIDPLDVSTQPAAGESINKLKYAFSEIVRQRSDAGADQNRLEHTIRNLDNVVENT